MIDLNVRVNKLYVNIFKQNIIQNTLKLSEDFNFFKGFVAFKYKIIISNIKVTIYLFWGGFYLKLLNEII